MSSNPAALSDVQPDGFFTRGLAAADAAVFAGLQQEITREKVVELLTGMEGVTVYDGDLPYPTPKTAEDVDGVQVGRIRRDPDYPKGWHMFVVADNLRKGAATNAVQIAEALMKVGVTH